jgi:hypothetical protein
VCRKVRSGSRRWRSAGADDIAAFDHVWRDEGSCGGERIGPQYVHVDVCLILKEGASGAGDVDARSEAG